MPAPANPPNHTDMWGHCTRGIYSSDSRFPSSQPHSDTSTTSRRRHPLDPASPPPQFAVAAVAVDSVLQFPLLYSAALLPLLLLPSPGLVLLESLQVCNTNVSLSLDSSCSSDFLVNLCTQASDFPRFPMLLPLCC